MSAIDDLTAINRRIGEMEQQPRADALAFFDDLLSDALVFRRASGTVVGKRGEEGFLATLGASPFSSRESEEISVTPLDTRFLATLVVVARRKDDQSVHRYRNLRLFSRAGERWVLELWYNYELVGN